MSDKTKAVSEAMQQVRLRTMEPADVQAFFCMENDPSVWQYTAQGDAPYTREQIEEFVCGAQQDLATAGQLRLVIEWGGVVVGAVDLYDYDVLAREAWVGILVWPADYRGRGVGGAALSLLVDYGLPIDRFWARVARGNQASYRLFLGAGFAPEVCLPEQDQVGGVTCCLTCPR